MSRRGGRGDIIPRPLPATTTWGLSVNYTRILAPAAVVFTVCILNAAPVHAQALGYRGGGGYGMRRGPVRAMLGARAFVGPRGAVRRPIVVGAPFFIPHYVVRPPVRVGYGVLAGNPVAFARAYANPYPYPNAYSYPSPAPTVLPGPALDHRIAERSSLALIGRIGGRLTRGVARLAFRLLIF